MIRWFDSSAIKGSSYDIKARVLEVIFRDGGDYIYEGVPPRTANDFFEADSKGRFFHEHILNRFTFKRLK